MKEATEVEEDSAVNRVDTMTAARLATPVVVSVFLDLFLSNLQATWQRTAVRAKNATTVVAWDTSAATATKLLKPKFATGIIFIQSFVDHRCQQPGHISRDCTNEPVETT